MAEYHLKVALKSGAVPRRGRPDTTQLLQTASTNTNSPAPAIITHVKDCDGDDEGIVSHTIDSKRCERMDVARLLVLVGVFNFIY